MFVHVPDPHPGRCKNLRPDTDHNGYTVTRRCLDYENVPHQCVFPKRRQPPTRGTGWGPSTIQWLQEPKAWVKPAEPEKVEE